MWVVDRDKDMQVSGCEWRELSEVEGLKIVPRLVFGDVALVSCVGEDEEEGVVVAKDC